MTEMCQNDGEPRAPVMKRRLARWIAGLTQLMALGALCVECLLLSGVIERRIVPALSRAFLGARITFNIEGWCPLCLSALRVADTHAPNTRALFEVAAIRINWGGTQFIDEVELLRPRLFVEGSDPDRPNYAFLLRFLGGDDSNENAGRRRLDINPLLPGHVRISGLDVDVRAPAGAASLRGLHGEVDIENLSHMKITLSGDDVGAGWTPLSGSQSVLLQQGSVSGTLERDGNAYVLDADAVAPDFFAFKGKASFSFEEGVAFDADVETLGLEGPLFGEFASPLLPVPLHFDSVSFAPVRVAGALRNGVLRLSDSLVEGSVTGLRIGDAEAPWYAGSIQARADGAHDATHSRATATLTLEEGLVAVAAYNAGSGKAELEIVFANWQREQALRLWPEALDGWRAYLPSFHTLGASLQCAFGEAGITFQGEVGMALDAQRDVSLRAEGGWRSPEDADVMAVLNVDGGAASVKAHLAQDRLVAGTLNIDNLDPGALIRMAAPLPYPDDLNTRLNGTGAFTFGGDADPTYEIALTAPALRFAAYEMPETLLPLVFEVTGSVSPGFNRIQADTALLRLEEAVTIGASRGILDLADRQWTAQVSGHAALYPLGVWLGAPDLWGEMSWEGNVALKEYNELLLDPFVFTFEPLGYDAHSLPYGQALRIEAPAHLALDSREIRVGSTRASLGEDTHLTMDNATIKPDGSISVSNATLVTEFAPLVAKGYLDEADGALTMVVDALDFRDGVLTANMRGQCAADTLVLPGDLARLHGLRVQTDMRFENRLKGDGAVTIETLTTGGMTFTGLQGLIQPQGNALVMDQISFALFGGGVVGRAEWNPLEPGLPLVVTGEANNIDLSVFTSEFDPESLVLTGTVNGVFAAGFTVQKITMLDVDLKAVEGFSMNRDMVEQLLLSQYMDEMAGGRQMSRMVQSVIGKAPQRAFDSAALLLGLEDERITGVARLESNALNLTVDIKADPAALLEALRVRQQQDN